MLEIKSLADQLRESLRSVDNQDIQPEKREKSTIQPAASPKKNTSSSAEQQKIDSFFKAI